MVCSGPLYEESLQQQRSITTNLFKKCKFRKQFSGLSLWLNIWNGDPQTMKGRRVLLLLGDLPLSLPWLPSSLSFLFLSRDPSLSLSSASFADCFFILEGRWGGGGGCIISGVGFAAGDS